MVNASLNWASISGLLLMALWVPALVVSLRRFDVLMDRDQPRASLQGLDLAWFLITLAGRCTALPLVGSIMFFQGWRLDPILQFGLSLLVWGTIVESIPSIRADHRALQQRSAKDGQQSSRQRALERRLRDRVWPWSFAHAVLPFAGIYYAITRRTITPLLWDFVARFVVLLITSGVFLIFQRFSDAETVNSWIPLAVFWVFWVLIVVNVFAGLLPVRVAIRRTQADARRRLEAHG
ncbi:hypothetical protein [Synechococcus sp. MIT S1220]|uniref:hypothetical protein n=1 Tax=Synechococcus sp. MIT S1220 TaxID=3082549 RepID=UPI0039B06FFB